MCADYHDWLLSEAVDILPHLLLPLAGPEELTEEEMEGMPEDLQYLDEDKKRETNKDIKKMLIEAVMKVQLYNYCFENLFHGNLMTFPGM